jgi:DNA uptake protein ComE-like DNA-binding protein
MKKLLMLLPAVALLGCGRNTDSAQDTSAAVAAAPTTGATTQQVASGEVQQQGPLVDPNTAAREQLTAAGLDTAAASAVVAGRPYADMVAVDKVLAARNLTPEQRKAVYAKIWKPIDLNTAKAEEILLIPGVGRRMLHEFEEYRPYKSMDQFRREIGKYVDKTELARLEQYVSVK